MKNLKREMIRAQDALNDLTRSENHSANQICVVSCRDSGIATSYAATQILKILCLMWDDVGIV